MRLSLETMVTLIRGKYGWSLYHHFLGRTSLGLLCLAFFSFPLVLLFILVFILRFLRVLVWSPLFYIFFSFFNKYYELGAIG